MKDQPLFLIWSMSRIDEQYSSAIFSLAKELAKAHQVVYVDFPFTLKDALSKGQQEKIAFREKCKREQGGLLHLPEYGQGFYVFFTDKVYPINWLPKGSIYSLLSGLNDDVFLKDQQKAIQKLSFSKLILINSFSPIYGLGFERYLSPDLVVYQCRDWIAQAPYVAKHGVGKEKDWIQKADLCLGTSSKITEYLKEQNLKSYLVANAANYELFSAENKPDLPAEFQLLNGKIITYTGNIGHRMNWALIEKFTNELSDHQFVFVGPETVSNKEVDAIKQKDNVHFLGARKLEELPAYVHHSDYLWIPFLVNDLTSAIYPLKLQEYFASGKPVFCTSFSADLNAFEKGIYFIDEAISVVDLIQQAGNEDESKSNQRKVWAKKNSWKQRKEVFLKLIEEYL